MTRTLTSLAAFLAVSVSLAATTAPALAQDQQAVRDALSRAQNGAERRAVEDLINRLRGTAGQAAQPVAAPGQLPASAAPAPAETAAGRPQPVPVPPSVPAATRTAVAIPPAPSPPIRTLPAVAVPAAASPVAGPPIAVAAPGFVRQPAAATSAPGLAPAPGGPGFAGVSNAPTAVPAPNAAPATVIVPAVVVPQTGQPAPQTVAVRIGEAPARTTRTVVATPVAQGSPVPFSASPIRVLGPEICIEPAFGAPRAVYPSFSHGHPRG